MRRIVGAVLLAAGVVVAVHAGLGGQPGRAFATTPTPSFTPTATPTNAFVLTSPLALSADSVRVTISTFGSNATGLQVVSNAPGCGAPTVLFVQYTSGGLAMNRVYLSTTEFRWPSACIDPGESITVTAIIPPQPFGRGNASALFFDSLTASPTPTPSATPTATPPPSQVASILLDCDTTAPGVQNNCTLLAVPGTRDIDVIIRNDSASPIDLGAFNFEILNPDTAKIQAVALPIVLPCDSNPDFNQTDVTGSWSCLPGPYADDEGIVTGLHAVDNPATQHSLLVAFASSVVGLPTIAPGSSIRIARIHYTTSYTGLAPASVPLSFENVAAFDGSFQELGSCLPVVDTAFRCVGATLNFVPPLQSVAKVPEGNAANANQSIPAANLYLCTLGPCAGAGEGNLLVTERASNVGSDYDADGIPDAVDPNIAGTGLANTELGLGAYEFQVEYDNFVIQSVNPCDIVFSPGGAGLARGNVTQLGTSIGCAANPPAINGTCAMSFILENLIRFGCVTLGQVLGPSGSFDLARLNLIPHPDLTNDIFPGNNNGVVTILKDNGCELVDIFGHPVIGSINGGLTPVCGDLAVTVRILEGDLNLDCRVNVTDEQAIATRYGGFFGSLLYSKWYDLEPATHDLDIDIKDLQKVFGRDGSSCQAPIPAQPAGGPPVPFAN